MSDITLESLIQEHKERLPYLHDVGDMLSYYEYYDMNSYHLWIEKTKRYLRQHFSDDPAVKEFEVLSSKELEPEQQKRLVAIIEALAIIPASAPHQRTKPITEKCPARILWYVSADKNSPRSKAIVACSYLDDVITGLPKDLFSRYKHYGIYEWSDIYKLCCEDIHNLVRALKFSQTQLFEKPV